MNKGNAALKDQAAQSVPATSDFTRELDDLSRKHGLVVIGHVEPIDLSWDGPDAEKWAQYGISSDGKLERGFWDV